MAQKFFEFDSSTGAPKLREATVTSAGAADAGEIIALDAGGKIDPSLLPTGVGAEVKLADAGENLASGDFVYIDSSGEARKADASAHAKLAVGFVLDSFTASAEATVYLAGINNAVSGKTVSERQFLSGSSPGASTATAPSTTGHTVQILGEAISATEIIFQPQIVVIL